MENLLIRDMTENDIGQVQILMGQLNEIFETQHDISGTAIKTTFLEMTDKKDNYINLIAEENGEIVGFISSAIYKTFFHSGGTLLINELIVDKVCRGRNVGKVLLDRIVELAEELGLNEVEVGTTFDNTGAIKFYKANGLTDESVVLGKDLGNEK